MYITKDEFISRATFPIAGVPKDLSFKDAGVFIQAVARELLKQNDPECPEWLILEFISDIYSRPQSPSLMALVEVSKSGQFTDAVSLMKNAILKVKQSYSEERDKYRPPKDCLYITDGTVRNNQYLKVVVYDVPGEMPINAVMHLPNCSKLVVTERVTAIPAGGIFDCPNLVVYPLSSDTVIRDKQLKVVAPVAASSPVIVQLQEKLQIVTDELTVANDNLATVTKARDEAWTTIKIDSDKYNALVTAKRNVEMELDNARRELLDANNQIASMREELTTAKSSNTTAEEVNAARIKLQATMDVLKQVKTELKDKESVIASHGMEIEELKAQLAEKEKRLSSMLTGDSYNAIQVERAIDTIDKAASEGALPTEKIQEIGRAMSNNKKKNKPIDKIRAILISHNIDMAKEQLIIEECFHSLPDAVRRHSKNELATVAESLEYFLSQQEKQGPTLDDVRAAIVKKYGDAIDVEKKMAELSAQASMITVDALGSTKEAKMLFLV